MYGFGIVFGVVLVGEGVEDVGVIIEVDQVMQVIYVVDIGVVWVQFDEVVYCSQVLCLFVLVVVGVGDVYLCLLGVGVEWVV